MLARNFRCSSLASSFSPRRKRMVNHALPICCSHHSFCIPAYIVSKYHQQLRYQMNKQSERNLPAADSHSGGDDDDDDNLGSTTKDHHPTSILDHDESLTFEMDEFSEDPSSSSGGSSSASSPWIEEPLDHHHNAAATADDLSSPEWFMSCAPMENDLSVGATKQQSSSSPPSSALLSMLPASEWCQQEEEEDEPHVTSV
mmetsp:Transcript_25956/g.54144  ORF Transcript_25956/g.54144 Transcript_25956/m.54144 type:complete len:200 (-) Transcript_25956:926-1525(-)